MRKNTHDQNWKTIDALAASCGVSVAARQKWRVRGVPWKWRVELTQKSGGVLSLNDFHHAEIQKQSEAA
jgi:hypothetical protein